MYPIQPIIERLEAMGESKYADFNNGLIPGVSCHMLGVRVPALRQIAREIAKESNWRNFLEASRGHELYELRLLHGMVLGVAKCEANEKIAMIDAFLPCIDNWAICDGTVSSIKPGKTDAEPLFEYACACAESDIEFRKRFGLILLMSRFHDEKHIARTMEIYRRFKHDGYYARMGAAWGLATLWLSDREGCLGILRKNLWDEWTHNKAIQKLCESRRISDADRTLARSLTRGKAETK